MISYTDYLRARWKTQSVQKMIRDLVEPPLLDIGCGDGWLLDGTGTRHGIDNYSRKKVDRDDVMMMDLRGNWGKVDRKYLTITAIYVLEHVSPSTVRNIFRKVDKHLVSGGRFIVVVPSEYCVWNRLDHTRPYPPQSITGWLNGDGHLPTPDLELTDVFKLSNCKIKPLRPMMHLLVNYGIGTPSDYFMTFEKC